MGPLYRFGVGRKRGKPRGIRPGGIDVHRGHVRFAEPLCSFHPHVPANHNVLPLGCTIGDYWINESEFADTLNQSLERGLIPLPGIIGCGNKAIDRHHYNADMG